MQVASSSYDIIGGSMRDRSPSQPSTAVTVQISRRLALHLLAAGAIGALAAACGAGGVGSDSPEPAVDDSPVTSPVGKGGVLRARPGVVVRSGEVTTGLQALGLERDEDAILYVPKGYTHAEPAPLIVAFHGAGGAARGGIDLFLSDADANGTMLLATRSRGTSWDVTTGNGFGPDIAFLDRALQLVFERYAIDPVRIAVAGFSDGASYALSVGLTNGDLFGAIMAFSPGFSAPGAAQGTPRIFISHGTLDVVLPIDLTGRMIASQLREAGYVVELVEFDGLHMVPDEIIDAALAWWLGEG
jgi:phospholipase/carboxylesterase